MQAHILGEFKHKITFLSLILIFIIVPLFFAEITHSYQINHVSVIINNNELYVTTSIINPEARFTENISEGISKEIIFFIDLFRVWKIWPDEFVRGKTITRILKSDPIKREYYALNIEGNATVEKRFKDIDSMISWAFNITDYKLTTLKDIERGKYFVKVTVESNTKKLPPLIGYFLFFIPEKEFSISKNSHSFKIPPESDNK